MYLTTANKEENVSSESLTYTNPIPETIDEIIDQSNQDLGYYDAAERPPKAHSLRRVAGRIAAVTTLAFGALTGAAFDDTLTDEAQAASPTCYGDYCSGQYADATHCDEDARTLTEMLITDKGVHLGVNISTQPGITVDNGGSEKEIARVEVRWSDTCGASWARLNTRQRTGINVLGIQAEDGYKQTRDVGGISEGSPSSLSFTPMIYGRDHAYQAWIRQNGSVLRAGVDTIEATYWTDEDLRATGN
jgi:hypothetical protein